MIFNVTDLAEFYFRFLLFFVYLTLLTYDPLIATYCHHLYFPALETSSDDLSAEIDMVALLKLFFESIDHFFILFDGKRHRKGEVMGVH